MNKCNSRNVELSYKVLKFTAVFYSTIIEAVSFLCKVSTENIHGILKIQWGKRKILLRFWLQAHTLTNTQLLSIILCVMTCRFILFYKRLQVSCVKGHCCIEGFLKSLKAKEITPAGCCCGDVWWPSGSPQRCLSGPWLPGVQRCGSNGHPPAGHSTLAAWQTAAPPETRNDGQVSGKALNSPFSIADGFSELAQCKNIK